MPADYQVVAAAASSQGAEADPQKGIPGRRNRGEAPPVAAGPLAGQHGEHEGHGADAARDDDAPEGAGRHAEARERHLRMSVGAITYHPVLVTNDLLKS